MMGGVHTDIDGATPLAGPVRRGRDRLREHQRRQPARLQLAAGVPGVRRPRRAGGRRVRRDRGRGRRPRSQPRPPTRCAGSSATCWARCRGADARRGDPRRDAGDDGGGRRDLPHRPGDGQGRRHPPGAAGAGDAGRRPRTPAGPSTPSWSPRSSWPTCSTSPSASSQSGLQREESRGAHQRTDFPARDDERFLTHQLVHRERRRDAPGRAAAGDDHPVAARRTGLREVRHGRDSITPAGDAVPARQGPGAAAGRSTTSRCARSGRSSTGSTTSRTRSTPRCRSAGRAGWASAAAAA